MPDRVGLAEAASNSLEEVQKNNLELRKGKLIAAGANPEKVNAVTDLGVLEGMENAADAFGLGSNNSENKPGGFFGGGGGGGGDAKTSGRDKVMAAASEGNLGART